MEKSIKKWEVNFLIMAEVSCQSITVLLKYDALLSFLFSRSSFGCFRIVFRPQLWKQCGAAAGFNIDLIKYIVIH